jgi:hypothetical protein
METACRFPWDDGKHYEIVHGNNSKDYEHNLKLFITSYLQMLAL